MRRKILRYPFKIIPAMSFGYTQDTEEKVNFFDMEGGEVGRRRSWTEEEKFKFIGFWHITSTCGIFGMGLQGGCSCA